MVAFIAELFLSTTSAEIGARSAILLIAGFIGVVLIRSIYREIKARQRIEELNAAMEEFLAITSHQIRTPLTHIKDALSLLREGDYGPLDVRAVPIVESVYTSTTRLIRLVNDLLDMSRMESGRMQYTFGEFDLNKLADSVAAEFKTAAAEKGIAIRWRKEKKPIFVRGDEEKIRQVVFNLVDNALKYTQRGMIEITVKSEYGKAVLSIRDSGAGMSSETIGRLFKKFARGDTGPKAKTHGTGLGLYVAKRIVDDHRGELWAESEGEGKGSVFYLRLLTKDVREGNAEPQEATVPLRKVA